LSSWGKNEMVCFFISATAIIAAYIFGWSIGRGKSDTTGLVKRDINRNNISTERGLGSLRTNNKESGRIIDEAKDTAGRGSQTIKDTNRTVSEIISASIGAGEKESD